MRGKRNSQLIYDLLKDKFEVEIVPRDDFSLFDKPFNLLIVDDYNRIKNKDLLSEIKSRELVYLPYILLSENERLINSGSKELDIFDDKLIMPLSKELFLGKVKLLLNYRESLYESYTLNLQKEHLIKEIHNKVSTNLETITRLLYLQVKRKIDMNSMEFCDATASRIRSMALAHERVYLLDNSEILALRPYITSLTEYLKESTDMGDNIKVNLDIDDVYLDFDNCFIC